MTGDGSFFPDPPGSQYHHNSKSVLSYHPVLEFNGNKNDFWLLFDDSEILEKRQSRPLRKPQKPSDPVTSAQSVVPVSKPGFSNTFIEATPKTGFLRPVDEPEDELSQTSDKSTSKERIASGPDGKKALLDRLTRSAYDPVPRKKEATRERKRSRSRERRRSRSPNRRRSRSPNRRRSPVIDRRAGDRRDRRRSRSREGRGRDRSRSRDRFRKSKRLSPSSSRKDRSKRSSSKSSTTSDDGHRGKADKAVNAELLKKFAEKLQEQANTSNTKKSLSSIRLNSRLEDTKHRRAEPITPIVFSLKKAPVKAFPATTTSRKTANIEPPKESVPEPMELSEPSEQVSSSIHIPLPTDIQSAPPPMIPVPSVSQIPPAFIPVPPPVSQIPPPLIPGRLAVSQQVQPLRVTDGVTVACAPTRYKDGKKAPVSSAVIALPPTSQPSSQPPPRVMRVPPPAVSQPLVIQPPPTASQPPPLMGVPLPGISHPMEAPPVTEMHQNLAAQALEYAAMTQVQDSMLHMGMPPPGFGPMMRGPPGPPPGLPRPGHGIRPGMMGSMMMGHGGFGPPGQFMGPHGQDGQFMGPPPQGPDGQFMGPPHHGPDGQFMGPPPQGPDGQFMGPPPLGPDGQFMGPSHGPDGQFFGPQHGPDGQFFGPQPGPDGQFFGPDGQFFGPQHGPDGQFFGPHGGPVRNNTVTVSATQSATKLSQKPPKNVVAATKVEVKTTSLSHKPTPSTVEKGKPTPSISDKMKPSSSTSALNATTSVMARTTSSIPDKKKSPTKPVLSSLSIPNFDKVKFMVELIKFLQGGSVLSERIAHLKISTSDEYCIKNGLLCKLKKGSDDDVLVIVVPADANARKTIVTAFVLKYPDFDVDALIELFEQTFHDMPMEDIEDVFEDESTRKSTLLKSTDADFSKIKSISSCGSVVLLVEPNKNTEIEKAKPTESSNKNVGKAITPQKIMEVAKAKSSTGVKKDMEKATQAPKIVDVEKEKPVESSYKNVGKAITLQKIVEVEKAKSSASFNKDIEKATQAQKIVDVEKEKPVESSNKNVGKAITPQKIVEAEKAKSSASGNKDMEKATPARMIVDVEKEKPVESSNKNVGKAITPQKIMEVEKAKSSASVDKDIEKATPAQKIIDVEKGKPVESSNKNVEQVKADQKIVKMEKVEPAESSDKTVEQVTADPKIVEVEKAKPAKSSDKSVEQVTANQNIEGEKTKRAESYDKTVEQVTASQKIGEVEKAKPAESCGKTMEQVTADQKTVEGEKQKPAESSDKTVEQVTANQNIEGEKTKRAESSDKTVEQVTADQKIVEVEKAKPIEDKNVDPKKDGASSTAPLVDAEQPKRPTGHESSKGKDGPADSTCEKKSEVGAIAPKESASVREPVLTRQNLPKDQPPDTPVSETTEVMLAAIVEDSATTVKAVSGASGSIDSDIKNKSLEAVKEPIAVADTCSTQVLPAEEPETLKAAKVTVIQTQSEPMETSDSLVVKPPEEEKTPTVSSDDASKSGDVGLTTQKTVTSAALDETTESGSANNVQAMEEDKKVEPVEVVDVPSAGPVVAADQTKPLPQHVSSKGEDRPDSTTEEKSEPMASASEAPSSAGEPVLTEENPLSDQPSDANVGELIVIGKSASEADALSKASEIDSDTKKTSPDAVKESSGNISNEAAPSGGTKTLEVVTDNAAEGEPKETSKMNEKTATVSSVELSNSDHVGVITQKTEPTAGTDEARDSGVQPTLMVNETKTTEGSAAAKDVESMKEGVELMEIDDVAFTAISPEQKESTTQPESSKVKEEAADSTLEKTSELKAIVSEGAEAKNTVLRERNPPDIQPLDPALRETPEVIEKSVAVLKASDTIGSIETDTKTESTEAAKEPTVAAEKCSTQDLPTESAEPPKMIDGDGRKDAEDPIKGEVASTTLNVSDETSPVSVDKMPLLSEEPKMPGKPDPLQELSAAAVQQENARSEPAAIEQTMTHVTDQVSDIQDQPELMETSGIPDVKEEIKTEEDISAYPEEASGVAEYGSKEPKATKSAEDVVEATDQSKSIPEPEIHPQSTSVYDDTTMSEKSDDLIQTTSSVEETVAAIKSEEVCVEIKEEPEPPPVNVEEEPTTTDTVKSEIIPAEKTIPRKQTFSKFKSTYELMKHMDFGPPQELYKEPDAFVIVNYEQLSFFTSRLREIQRGSDVASVITKMLLVPYSSTDEFVIKNGLLCKRKDQKKNDVFIVLLKSTAVYREIVSALTEQYPDLEFNEFMSLIDSSFAYITPAEINSLVETIDLQTVNIKYQNFIEKCNIVNGEIIEPMLEQLRNYQKADSAILHRYTRLKANGGLDDSYILKYDLVCQFVGTIDFKVSLPKSQPDQIAIMYTVHESTNHNRDLLKFLELLRTTFEGVNASLIERPIALCSVCHPPAIVPATTLVKVCEQRCAALKYLPPEVIYKIRQIQMASSVFKAQIELLTKGQSRQGSRYILDTSLLCKAMTRGNEQVFRVVVSPSGLKEVISLLHTTYHRKPFDEFVSFVSEFLAVTEDVCKAAFQECYMCTKSKTTKTLVEKPKPQTPKVIDADKASEKKHSEPPQEEVKRSSTASSKIPSGKDAKPKEREDTRKETGKDAKPKEREDTRKETSKPTKDAPSKLSSTAAASTSKASEPEPLKPTWEVKEKATPPPKTARGEKVRRHIMSDLRKYNSIWGHELADRIRHILRIVPDRILTDIVPGQRACPEISKTIKDLANTKPIKDAKEMLCGGILFVLRGRLKPKIAVKAIKNINYLLITTIHSEVHDWSINKIHGTIGIAFDVSPCKGEVEATIDWFCHGCMRPETEKKKRVYGSLDEQLEHFYSTIEPILNQAKAPKDNEETPKKADEKKPEAEDYVHQEIRKDLNKLDEIWGRELAEKIKAISLPIPASVLEAVIAAQRECSALMEIIEPLETEPPVKDARHVLCGRVLFVVKSKKKQMLVKIYVKPIKNINYILITNLHSKCHDWTVNRLQTTIGISFDVSPTREEVAVTIDWFCAECQKPDTKSKKKKTAASLEDQLKDLYDTIDPALLKSKDDDDDQEVIDLTQEVPVTDVRAALAKLPNPVVSKIQQAQVQSNVLNTQIKLLENTEGPAKGKGYCLVMSLLCKLVEVNGKPAWRVMIPSDMLKELVVELHTVHYHDMIQEDFSEYLNMFMTVPDDMINELFAGCALCLTTVRRVPTLCERGINEDHLRKILANIAEMIEYVVKWQTECPPIAKIREGVKRCRQEIIDQYILYKDILFKLSGKNKGKGPRGKIAVSLLPNALNEVIKGVHAFYHSSNPNQLMNLINTSFDVTAQRDIMVKTILEVCKICKNKSEAKQGGAAAAAASKSGDGSAAHVKEEPKKPDEVASSAGGISGGAPKIKEEEVDLPIEIKAEDEEKVDLPGEVKAEDEPTPLGVLLLGRLCDQVIEESSNSSRALDSPVPDLTETKPSPVVRQRCKIILKRCKYDPDIVVSEEAAKKGKRAPKKPPAKRRKPPKTAKNVQVSEPDESESDSGSSLPKRKFVVYSSESETDDSTSKKRKATGNSSQKAKKPKK